MKLKKLWLAAILIYGLTIVFPCRTISIDWGDDETSGITTTDYMDNTDKAGAQWYSLDGRRLSGKPTAKGVYISNGKKIVINR